MRLKTLGTGTIRRPPPYVETVRDTNRYYLEGFVDGRRTTFAILMLWFGMGALCGLFWRTLLEWL